jgi:20S proteasome alpha/beta subunit
MLLKCALLIIILATGLSSMLIGVVTKDAVILSSNNVFSKNGVAMRGDFDWIKQLGDDCLVGVQGDSSDCDFLLSQLESSNRDHQMTFGRSLSCRSVANLCRRIISKFLRSNQLKISVLIAGWDGTKGLPLLFWLDSIG